MTETQELIDYERLTLDALDRAAQARTPSNRRDHLNQAAVYATLGERTRADDRE